MTPPVAPTMTGSGFTSRLRRDLGTLESYAALLGILIGAGIFRVTSDAWLRTGPSVILAQVVFAPLVLATSMAYAVFLSTPLGTEPGGEYTHISRTFRGYETAFLAVWLKIIAYIGALAYMANAFADYAIEGSRGLLHAESHRLPLALGTLVFFFLVHAVGVRWFGRLQVAMCAILGASLLVLIVPGLFAVRSENYRPFFTHGLAGFATCMPSVFFAFAGFEALAQTAGEVKESTRRLPGIFFPGILATTAIYVLMSAVTFGVLPGSRLAASTAPMAEVAAVYLPAGAALFVTLGALMALASSLSASMLVPSRIGIMLAADRLAPSWIGVVHPRTGTPIRGLLLTLAASGLLLASGQLSLALNIAVFGMVILYFLHSLTLLLLPWRNPALFGLVRVRLSLRWQRAAALLSLAAMGGLIVVQVVQDLGTVRHSSLGERLRSQSMTGLELAVVWGTIGVVIYLLGRWRGAREGHVYAAALALPEAGREASPW